ncbi:MAG: DEAD/DEAH box helicase [Cyclobacteriaceae bacterium]|nr:DEAD/DEAH box helicase [Cyclobacteriaceae bacterium]
MLFERDTSRGFTRPSLPKGTNVDYEIGFLFNFASGRSTGFDFEPLLIYTKNSNAIEYKRISLQAQKALAYLQPLDDALYYDFLQFSDAEVLAWMAGTGNRFIRNANTGSWKHSSARELKNIRKHYVNLLYKIWPKLVEQPHVFILKSGRFDNYKQQPVQLGQQPVNICFSLELDCDLIVLKLIVLIDGQPTKVNLCKGILFEKDHTLFLPPNAESLALFDQFTNGNLKFPLSNKMEVVKKHILPLKEKYEVAIDPRLHIEWANYDCQPRVRLSELNESNLMIRAEFSYASEFIEYDEELNFANEQDDRIEIIQRDKTEEAKLHEYLRMQHPSFVTQRNNPYFYLPFADVMKKGWLVGMMRNLQERGYAIAGLPELKKFRYSSHIPKFTVAVSSTIDWFDLKVAVQWGDQAVPLKEIRMALLNWQDTIMLDDGTLGHIPEAWIKQYSLLLRTGKEENGVLKISKIHFALLDDVLLNLDSQSKQEIETRKRKLLEYDTIQKAPLSKKIKAKLRPYQQSGFHWLQALDDLGWGGCLADDMGLGKTLQTISFLQFLKETYPGSTQLVVCPTSLIFNWESELQKFCPSLKYYTHYGTQRELRETHAEEYDIILTSYGVVRNDLTELSSIFWQYIILDESQAIKNPDARVTKAVNQLRSVNRIILSGTPVQNNTFDLYSQFNFLNPGLLGNREFFNREFATPIDRFGSKEKAQHLKKLVYPFTLRRTKEQVASDLPEKTVTILWCTMEASQRKLYNEYRDGYKRKILKKIDEEGIGKSGLDVLEGLLRLRQICDHPALVNNTNEMQESSVKINELTREVKENAGNHKLLIFSQFTQMLQLIQGEFDKASINYCYLDGSTPLNKRKDQVAKFQEDENIKAFLISLKAGGVGLNLTTADYVYIVDPWWNPAVEQQAIDRAHRIGQKRNVFAYKMICKDSVEEKIIQLQERKQALADDLIQEDASFVKTLSRADVEFLFG